MFGSRSRKKKKKNLRISILLDESSKTLFGRLSEKISMLSYFEGKNLLFYIVSNIYKLAYAFF